MRTVFLIIFQILCIACIYSQNTAVDYLEKAIILQKENDTETALLMCSKAIQMDSTLTPAHFLRGYVNYLLENYRDAIADFTKAIDQKPDYIEAIYYRGRAKHANGNFLGALQDYNKSRELSPAQTTLMVARGWFSSLFGGSNTKENAPPVVD
ncbi:MAG: tetratricopeptide repeat protein [Bacteroidales bacterium]|nr:tetratricopeptide repeat protein [Bacteroidales bacterium]